VKRMLLAAIVALGLTVTVGAQHPSFPKPIQEVAAKTAVTSNGSITQWRGDVTIRIPGAVILADEATIDAATNRVDLRGSVRLRMTTAVGMPAEARLQPFPKGIRELTAHTGKSDGVLTQWKGDVALVIEGAVVHADEATTDAKTNEVALRGNVRITLTQGPAPVPK
jgi:lipopolysaccharide assembly outer membrane protein LptD (OstA)